MIGFIAAMDIEVEAIVACCNHYQHKQLHGIDFYEGVINNTPCVILKSGIGKVAASISTTILLEHYDIDEIINIGTAGGLKSYEQVLDGIVSSRVVQHDFDTSMIDGEAGIGLYFECDEKLIKRSIQALESLDVKVHVGLVASGDQFIAADKDLKRLSERFPDAICAEMEAGGIAQVAKQYQIPFIVIRSLSDVACNSDSHIDYLSYCKQASVRSAKLAKQLCK